MKKQSAIICDLDGTLCDISHRMPLLPTGDNALDNAAWHKFHTGISDDAVIEPIKLILDSVSAWCVDILIVTARPEQYKNLTTWWLAENKIQTDALYMRPNSSQESDDEVKLDIYKRLIEPKYDVQFVLEDRAHVVKMWRDNGLFCLQNCLGDY